jgi:hypothetical protein
MEENALHDCLGGFSSPEEGQLQEKRAVPKGVTEWKDARKCREQKTLLVSLSVNSFWGGFFPHKGGPLSLR